MRVRVAALQRIYVDAYRHKHVKGSSPPMRMRSNPGNVGAHRFLESLNTAILNLYYSSKRYNQLQRSNTICNNPRRAHRSVKCCSLRGAVSRLPPKPHAPGYPADNTNLRPYKPNPRHRTRSQSICTSPAQSCGHADQPERTYISVWMHGLLPGSKQPRPAAVVSKWQYGPSTPMLFVGGHFST